jgi:hypothetical protein
VRYKPWFFLLILAALIAVVMVASAYAATKAKLPRDEIYYEINNDNGDHGNYIETFHVPNGRGGKVYCIVYSDKIENGGGAGIDCDWANSR